jgi:hypothetical protein
MTFNRQKLVLTRETVAQLSVVDRVFPGHISSITPPRTVSQKGR